MGIDKTFINEAKEYFKYNEFYLCYDTILYQILEYSIKINNEDHILLCQIADQMGLTINQNTLEKLVVPLGTTGNL